MIWKFWHWYCGKKQIDIIQSTHTVRSLINKLTVDLCGLYSYQQQCNIVIIVDSLGCLSWVHNILTTVMTNIVVDKSTDYTKPLSIFSSNKLPFVWVENEEVLSQVTWCFVSDMTQASLAFHAATLITQLLARLLHFTNCMPRTGYFPTVYC